MEFLTWVVYHVDPVVVPLPPSPVPSISVSMATPNSTNRPSIRMTLVTETETEVTRTEAVTRDIKRTLGNLRIGSFEGQRNPWHRRKCAHNPWRVATALGICVK